MTKHDSTPIPFDRLDAPARVALIGAGFRRLRQLEVACEDDLARLHGIGPRALTILREALDGNGMAFSKKCGMR